jgi:hypothetical protein
MHSVFARLTLFCVAQIAALTVLWFLVVVEWRWDVVQQFLGHIGPGAFLVGMGVAAIFLHKNTRTLTRYECYLAILAGAAYVLADTFIMHPPWGVFSDPGQAEQEHVSIMAMVFMLGVSGLVLQRKFANSLPAAAHFFVGVSVVAIVFGNHPQHTVTGGVGHYATMLFLAGAVVFRIMDRYIEYAVLMIITGFVFFGSQTGLAEYVDTVGNSAGAWIALWSTLGFVSATGFLALSPGDEAVAGE